MTFKIHACKAVQEKNWRLMLQHDGVCGYCGEDLGKEQLLSQLAAVTADRDEARADIREWEASREEATAQFAALLTERDEARTALHQAKQLNEADNAALKKAWDERDELEEAFLAAHEACADISAKLDAALARVAQLEGVLQWYQSGAIQSLTQAFGEGEGE